MYALFWSVKNIQFLFWICHCNNTWAKHRFYLMFSSAFSSISNMLLHQQYCFHKSSGPTNKRSSFTTSHNSHYFGITCNYNSTKRPTGEWGHIFINYHLMLEAFFRITFLCIVTVAYLKCKCKLYDVCYDIQGENYFPYKSTEVDF